MYDYQVVTTLMAYIRNLMSAYKHVLGAFELHPLKRTFKLTQMKDSVSQIKTA